MKIKRRMHALLAMVMIAGCLLAGCDRRNKNNEDAESRMDTLVDFLVQAEEGSTFRILQLTDTQIVDPGQSRYSERIGDTTPITDERLYQEVFYYIEDAVNKTSPDLILMTGDLVYGEFDDSGESLSRLVDYMDSFGIPWAPVWGDHDNESTKGVTWQCQQFENAEYCLFKRGEVSGNSNYTIGIRQGDQLIRVIYMMDSNGCVNGYSYSYLQEFGEYNQEEQIITQAGFDRSQLEWLEATSVSMEDTLGYAPPKFAAFHIPIAEYSDAATQKGYQSGDEQKEFYIKDPSGEDFGKKYESIRGMEVSDLWKLLKKHNFDGIFAGHNHTNNFSIVYDGIRLTCGVKTGIHDRNRRDMLGGTVIDVAEGGESFTVEHCYVSPQ